MQFDPNNNSPDVEDRRGEAPARGGGGVGGIGLLLPLMARFGWKGGLAIFAVIAVAGFFFMRPSHMAATPGEAPQVASQDSARAYVGSVLDDVQKTWAAELPGYQHAHVVLYSEAITTGCGLGRSAVGPFYCPRDEKVYLDVSFFRELHDRFGVNGDFARAYVIAHELGHHVQRLSGAFDAETSSKERGDGSMSVRMELQADCYAGMWARSAEKRGLLEPGDLSAAISAAAAVGDDRLQKQATGTIRPETWTHGSSAERTRWFQRGHDAANASACDTSHSAL